MAVKFTNNAKTTLASGINSSVTTATVTDGSVFPTLGSGEHFYCTFDDGTNNEIVKVTARSGNTLTIVRGVDNTTARSFSASDAAELRATSALLTDIQENIAAKSANQTVYNTTTASSATDYDIGIDPSVEANAMVFLNGVMQHHDTFSFSGSTLTFDTAPPDGMALEVIVDNLINLQSSNLTVDTFTAADVGGNPQTDFTLSDAPAAEDNLLVFIDGVFQDQDAYTISNQTLTITDGVTADFGVTVYVINPVNIGTPSDGTVTSSKLSGNITMPADLTVTGDVAFDSPTFVVDNANSRVGIGTASPSTLLDIVGDVKMSANLTVDTDTLHVDATNNTVEIGSIETTTNYPLIVKSGTNDHAIAIEEASGAETWQLGVNVNGDLGFYNSGATTSSVSFIDGAGQVLIGEDTGDAFNADAMLRLQRTGDRVFQQFKVDADQEASIFFGDVDDDVECGIVYQAANQNLILRTGNNNDAITIDNNQNVGIGGSPTNYSDHKTLSLYGNTGTGAGFIEFNDTSGNADAVIFSDDGNLFINADYDNTAASSSIRFRVDGSSEKMRIDSSGLVSIGNTVASSMDAGGNNLVVGTGSGTEGMTIYSGTANSGVIYFADGASGDDRFRGQIGYSHSDNSLSFRTNASSSANMTIDSSGNVGITAAASIRFNGAGDNTHAVGYDSVIDGSFMRGQSGMRFLTGTGGGSERMRIASNGRVSIGTTSTNAGLTVANADIRCTAPAIANDANSISMSYESVGGVIAVRGPSTSTRGTLSLSVNQSNGGGGRVGFKIDNLGLIYAEYMGSGGATTDVNYNTSTGEIYQVTSSQRYKENISEYTDSILEKVNNLTVKNFDYKEGGYTNQIGLIAEEVEEQIPYLVNKKEIEGYDEPQPDSVKYSQLSVFLLKAIQEQQELIETLKQEIREIREGG